MDTLHIPSRLPGETLSAYHYRQQVSRLSAARTRLLVDSSTHRATSGSEKKRRKALKALHGARQARKMLRQPFPG